MFKKKIFKLWSHGAAFITLTIYAVLLNVTFYGGEESGSNNSLVKEVTGKRKATIAVRSISDLFKRITHSYSFMLLLFLPPFVILGIYVYRIAPERIGFLK